MYWLIKKLVLKVNLGAILLVAVLVLILSLMPANLEAAGSGPRLVGLWHFNEGSGVTTVRDSSGAGNTGKVFGATTGVAGKFGNGLMFDGTDNYVDFGSDDSLKLTDKLTIELWVMRTDKTTFERFLSHSIDANTYAYEVGVDWKKPDEWRFRMNNDSKTVQVPMAGKVGQWIHVAFVYDRNLASGNMKIYENGVEVARGNYNKPLTNHGTLRTNRQGKSDGWLKSTMDEVRIWNGALTASQLNVLYHLSIDNH